MIFIFAVFGSCSSSPIAPNKCVDYFLCAYPSSGAYLWARQSVHVALIGLEVLSLKLVFESHFGKIYKSLFFFAASPSTQSNVSLPTAARLPVLRVDNGIKHLRLVFVLSLCVPSSRVLESFFSFIVSVCGLEIEFCVFLSISAFVAIRWTRRASGDEANVHKWHYGFINIQPRRSE